MRLTDKVALVTGGSRGIGRALCLGLAREGARVAVNYVAHAAAAQVVVEEIKSTGGEAVAVQADVSRATDMERLVRTAAERIGPITILVNNAALTDVHKPWQQISEEEWDHVMAVSLKGAFLGMRAVYPFMRNAGWGRVINISSVAFWLGRPNLLHYVAAKAGMIGFTRTLARELGAEGITVNAITPGAIRTESEVEMFPDQASLALWLSDVQAVKRRGIPEDIVGATIFLASDESAFITGQTLNVDGGWAMH